MFVIKNILFAFLIFVSFETYYSKSIRDDKYFGLFVANPTTGKGSEEVVTESNEVETTTYDWGQWTKTEAPGSETTYDWGQHTATGSTYDWGQHTGTGSTYDWTKTEAPGSKTTYDWGQWTSTEAPGSRTTYDWGQHTKTSSPNDDNSTSTENPNGNEYRCAAGQYTCKGTIGLCIKLSQICDGKQDCPHRDDEDPKVCFPGFGGNKNKKKNLNNFSGTGFMFNIRNIVIKDKSDVELFEQESNNKNTRLIMRN